MAYLKKALIFVAGLLLLSCVKDNNNVTAIPISASCQSKDRNIAEYAQGTITPPVVSSIPAFVLR